MAPGNSRNDTGYCKKKKIHGNRAAFPSAPYNPPLTPKTSKAYIERCEAANLCRVFAFGKISLHPLRCLWGPILAALSPRVCSNAANPCTWPKSDAGGRRSAGWAPGSRAFVWQQETLDCCDTRSIRQHLRRQVTARVLENVGIDSRRYSGNKPTPQFTGCALWLSMAPRTIVQSRTAGKPMYTRQVFRVPMCPSTPNSESLYCLFRAQSTTPIKSKSSFYSCLRLETAIPSTE